MDDPWGSPWAEETPHLSQDLESQPDTRNVADTPARSTKLSTRIVANSPWDNEEEEDDGFGDWSSAPLKVENMSPGVEYASEWSSQPVRNGHDHVDDESSLQWKQPEHSNTPEYLRSSQTAFNPSPDQEHPDPWSKACTHNDYSHATNKSASPGSQIDDFHQNRHIVENLDEGNGQEALFESSATSDVREDDKSKHTRVLQNGLYEVDNLTLLKPELGQASPRSSISHSDTSQHENHDHQETPRTSLDDEHIRPKPSRNVSSKIQPLVEHFDRLTPKALKEQSKSTNLVAGSVQAQLKSIEHGINAKEHGKTSAVTRLSVDELPPSHFLQVAAHKVEGAPPISTDHVGTAASVSESSRTIKDDIGIEIDLSKLDTLFPEVNDVTQHEETFIPDVVPYESFTSMEQRKMWYRISRYGSMRKHDAGGDGMYAPLTWSKSRVHDETIKVVARWMEEDRLSGQVMLGGTGRTSALFGWGDAKSPPVSLEAVFAARQNKRKSGIPESFARGSVDAQSPVVAETASEQTGFETESKLTESIPSFGWGAENEFQRTLPSPKVPRRNSSNRDHSRADLVPPNFRHVLEGNFKANGDSSTAKVDHIDPEQDSEFAASSTNVEPAVLPLVEGKSQDTIDDETEDDWGEMVSTAIPENDSCPDPRLSTVDKTSGSSFVSSAQIVSTPSGNPQNSDERKFKPQEPWDNATNSVSSTKDVELDLPSSQQADLTSIASDSWASADFSFFDSAPRAPTQSTSSAAAKTVPIMPTPSIPMRPSPLKQVTSNSSFEASARESTNGLSESDELLVQNIISKLPDLSYMLKR